MTAPRRVTMGAREMRLQCDCGWQGAESDVVDWAVQEARDRLVRVCPGCQEPIPEWGTVRSLAGARAVAKGPIREAFPGADGAEE